MLYFPANFKDLDIILRNNLGALGAMDRVPKMRFYASSEAANDAMKGTYERGQTTDYENNPIKTSPITHMQQNICWRDDGKSLFRPLTRAAPL